MHCGAVLYGNYLCGVHFALDDVEDGDVAALFGAGGHHDVLRLG